MRVYFVYNLNQTSMHNKLKNKRSNFILICSILFILRQRMYEMLYIPIYLYILDIKLVYICIKIYSILIKLSYVHYLNKNVNSSLMHNSGVLYLYRCYDDSVTNKCKIQIKAEQKTIIIKKSN